MNPSRRGLFGLLGATAIASVLPKPAAAPLSAILSEQCTTDGAAGATLRYAHTEYGMGYLITKEDRAHGQSWGR